MRVDNPSQYKLIRFQKSRTKNKMYDAIIENKITGKQKRVPFGDNRYENYRDITKLNLYPNLIHGDKQRRKRFRSRHYKNAQYKFSPAYFSYNYLW